MRIDEGWVRAPSGRLHRDFPIGMVTTGGRVISGPRADSRVPVRCPICGDETTIGVDVQSLATHCRPCVDRARRARTLAAAPAVGTRFDRWTVSGPGHLLKKGIALEVRCDCGIESRVQLKALRAGKSRSCGCLWRDMAREPRPAMQTHGQSRTRLHNIWLGMIQRCYNENDKAYRFYGGRGVFICDEWRSDFVAFRDWSEANGYADDLSIDRVDPDDGYCPDNCRWITMSENSRRARKSTVQTRTKVYEKTCKVCEAPFTAQSPKAFYCSPRCKWTANR